MCTRYLDTTLSKAQMSALPTPVSSSKHRRPFRRSDVPISPARARDILLSRARVTNLGFLVLAVFAFLSFMYNLSFYFSYARIPWDAPPESILSTISRSAGSSSIDHLIIVPGHSIWTGFDPALRLNEDQWILETYQQGGGRVEAFVSHIVRG